MGEGVPSTNLARLCAHPNVHLMGARPYALLPDYLRGFDLALLPCPINAYTRSMFPMKFFEYVAAGVPIVATALPALSGQAHMARLCADAPGFLASVDELRCCPPREGARRPIPLEMLPSWCSYRGRTAPMLAELSHQS